jgi:hypothetical protein
VIETPNCIMRTGGQLGDVSADDLRLPEIEGAARNGQYFSGGDEVRIDGGVAAGHDLQLMVQDAAAE